MNEQAWLVLDPAVEIEPTRMWETIPALDDAREIAVLGSCGSNGEIPECVDLLARGVIDVDPIISLKAPLDAGPELFARLHKRDRSLMKVIIQP